MVRFDVRKNFITLALNRDREVGRGAPMENLSSPTIQPAAR